MIPGNARQLADFKRALDHAAIVAITDVTGRITYVNDKFCDVSGYSREELSGADHRIVNSAFHPKEFIRELWRTIAAGRVWHGEIRNRAKDGHFYWVDTTIVPFLDDRGKPYQYIAIRSDITARKHAEAHLVEQAALAQVGQLAAVVAHEVRNPLAGIKCAMQILMSRRDAAHTDVAVMNDIVARIDSLSELINDLIVFARPRPPRRSSLDIRPLVLDAVAAAQRDPAAAHIVIDVDAVSIVVEADADLLRTAVLNLLLNAVQAVAPRGRVAVEVTAADEQVTIAVRDDGPGIPTEIRERVSEPFFTTKARGGGLGLPIATRTAQLHGGALTLSCPDSGGTLVTLTLPATARPRR